MTDIFDLSETPVATVTPASTPETPVNGRRKRGPGKRAAAKAAPENGAVPVKRRGRPPGRVAAGLSRDPALATATASPGGMKIDLSVAISTFAYLKEEDLALTSKIVQALSTVNKGSRARILEALGKVFA